MALENVGDVSPKTRGSSKGYYIIKYVGDVEEGPVDLDTVSETIKAELWTADKTSFWNETVERWVTEAKPKIDKKALND